jgi:hypothetical protein
LTPQRTGATFVQARTHDTRRSRLIETLRQDATYAVRGRREPVMAIVATVISRARRRLLSGPPRVADRSDAGAPGGVEN